MKNSFYPTFLVVIVAILFATGCEKGATTSEGKKPVEDEPRVAWSEGQI